MCRLSFFTVCVSHFYSCVVSTVISIKKKKKKKVNMAPYDRWSDKFRPLISGQTSVLVCWEARLLAYFSVREPGRLAVDLLGWHARASTRFPIVWEFHIDIIGEGNRYGGCPSLVGVTHVSFLVHFGGAEGDSVSPSNGTRQCTDDGASWLCNTLVNLL